MNNTLIITLLTTTLTTLTTVLGLVDTLPGVHNLSQEINTAISAITGALNILNIPS